MRTPSSHCLFALTLLVLALAAGCAPRYDHPVAGTASDPTYSGARNDSTEMKSVRTPVTAVNAPRYYRDDAGRLYLMDGNGNLHAMDRRVRVLPGTGGIYSIVDEQNIRYYHDETGRLYYRDREGRIVYIDESPRVRTMSPIPYGKSAYAPASSGRTEAFCNQQWSSCMNKCNDISNVQTRLNCLDECDFRREQCTP